MRQTTRGNKLYEFAADGVFALAARPDDCTAGRGGAVPVFEGTP